MSPYYDDGAITIYHGDCRSFDDWQAATAVITDPPYGMAHYETDRTVLDGSLLTRWIQTFPTVAVFGYPERLVGLCVQAGAIPVEWITWWPTNGANRGTNLHGLWKESECIAVFGAHHFGDVRVVRDVPYRADIAQRGLNHNSRGGSHGNPDDRHAPDVWRDKAPGLGLNAGQRRHPNEKPTSVMTRLLEGIAGNVADPFMGSGSTLVAAKSLGRRAVGVEIDEKYCEVAAKRCAQGVLWAAS